MFTGIIEELGTIRGVSLTKNGGELQIAATTVLGGTKLGDSIAVNGTCLTVTKLEKDGFTAFVMAESLRRTNLGNLKRGSVVHLERAMAADGRFAGIWLRGTLTGKALSFPRNRRDKPLSSPSVQTRKSFRALWKKAPSPLTAPA